MINPDIPPTKSGIAMHIISNFHLIFINTPQNSLCVIAYAYYCVNMLLLFHVKKPRFKDEAFLLSNFNLLKSVWHKNGVGFKSCFFDYLHGFVKEEIQVVGVVGVTVYDYLAVKLAKEREQVK